MPGPRFFASLPTAGSPQGMNGKPSPPVVLSFFTVVRQDSAGVLRIFRRTRASVPLAMSGRSTTFMASEVSRASLFGLFSALLCVNLFFVNWVPVAACLPLPHKGGRAAHATRGGRAAHATRGGPSAFSWAAIIHPTSFSALGYDDSVARTGGPRRERTATVAARRRAGPIVTDRGDPSRRSTLLASPVTR